MFKKFLYLIIFYAITCVPMGAVSVKLSIWKQPLTVAKIDKFCKKDTCKQLKLHLENSELTVSRKSRFRNTIYLKGSFFIANKSLVKKYDFPFLITLYDQNKRHLITILSSCCVVNTDLIPMLSSISVLPQEKKKVAFDVHYIQPFASKDLVDISNAKYYSFSIDKIDKYEYKEELAVFRDLLNTNEVFIISVIGCCAALISFLVYKFKNKSRQQKVRDFAEASDEYTDDVQLQ